MPNIHIFIRAHRVSSVNLNRVHGRVHLNSKLRESVTVEMAYYLVHCRMKCSESSKLTKIGKMWFGTSFWP